MLFSVAIAMAVCYPTILLSGNPTAGLAAHPNQMWTSAKTMNGSETEADVEMRQVWIYGSHMQALTKDVLQQGLMIQQTIVGSGTSAEHTGMVDNVTTKHQSGFHSPLMYWNNSGDVLEADVDVLRTINERKHHSSSPLNVVLRPASVFAGKRFDRKNLLAADALVITLINKMKEGVGARWQLKMSELSKHVCQNCTLHPPNGDVTKHRVYEFSFKPLTLRENLALGFAYGLMALYVLLSLRRMKAFHSRFGLVVTAITQMTFSFLASFTICGILHINLATIPRNAYPFVILVIGLENMFRLINAVLAYPPTMATDIRIANALGDIGPLSIANAAQNLTILSILSTVVSPGVAAFCAFAAIATLFDVFFLLTFFTAVLNVDIRRLELQDSIAARQSTAMRPSRNQRRQSPAKRTWFDALLSGRLPFSTRMAGTAVTTTFILALNYHFFELEEMASGIGQLVGLGQTILPSLLDLDSFATLPINASMTPSEWMRMQDFDAAKEVMKLANPGDTTFKMRIFAPLIVVLPGSDRSGAMDISEGWSQTFRVFTIHHFYPVAIAVVFGVAFVSVLMNFLLYNEPDDEAADSEVDMDEDGLKIMTVPLPHKLDIIKIAAHENGHFVTVALDRTISSTTTGGAGNAYNTTLIASDVLQMIKWPIHNLAINADGRWTACHCGDGRILLHTSEMTTDSPTFIPYPDDHSTLIFEFVVLLEGSTSRPYFVALTAAGRLTMCCLDDLTLIGLDISFVQLVGAAFVQPSEGEPTLLVVTENGHIISFAWSDKVWMQTRMRSFRTDEDDKKITNLVHIMPAVSQCKDIIAIAHATGVTFLQTDTLDNIGALSFDPTKDGQEDFLLGRTLHCSFCNGLAVRTLTFYVDSAKQGMTVFTTWSIEGDDDDYSGICLAQKSPNCIKIKDGKEMVTEMRVAGASSAPVSGTIIGLRKRDVTHDQHGRRGPGIQKAMGLRQRRQARQDSHLRMESELWEAYKVSHDGGVVIADMPLGLEDEVAKQHILLVEEAGPAAPLDGHAVVVAFGNAVKVIQGSRRGSVTGRSRGTSLERQSSISKRRAASRKQR